jgi:hypothetical protein
MDAMNEVMIAPDFLALGLGGTNMMSMLWTVAMGRQAVGVEMRGDPFLGVHWNIREDFYHQLGLLDQMMLERYGEALWAMRMIQRWAGFWFRFLTSKPSIPSSRDSFQQGLTQIRPSSLPPTNI